jgi:hypothetical protein
MKKPVLLLSALLALAGCDALFHPNHFVGTWIGHGELVEADTPNPGDTTETTIDDVVIFSEDLTFEIQQGYQQVVNDVVSASLFQMGTGTYAYTETVLTMSFNPTSDPGLNSDTPAYAFSDGNDTCTIQPTTLAFPIVFQRVD